MEAIASRVLTISISACPPRPALPRSTEESWRARAEGGDGQHHQEQCRLQALETFMSDLEDENKFGK